MPKIAFLADLHVAARAMAAFNAIFPVIVATTTTVWPQRTY
jgi:hypothetical protein